MVDKKQFIQPLTQVNSLILTIRGERVIIDTDLARLYGVPTKHLNLQVRRNRKKFPEDFMFQLSKEEKAELVTNCYQFKNLKHSRSLPHAFTEHGALMAANVLNSECATEMSVYVIRAFIKMRGFIGQQAELARKLTQLEGRVSHHDKDIQAIIETIRRLMEPPKSQNRSIGFKN